MRVYPYCSAMITLDKYDSALHQELLANAEDYLLIKCFVHFQMRLHVKYICPGITTCSTYITQIQDVQIKLFKIN